MLLAAGGREAIQAALSQELELVFLLDLLLPDISGMDVCRMVREKRSVPILVVSARDEEITKMNALDLGADDYMTKPFGTGELLARIRAFLGRCAAESLPAVIHAGGLEIDVPRRRVFREGKEIRLTRTEFDILACLARDPDSAVGSKALIGKIRP